jgi:hypothetical protein
MNMAINGIEQPAVLAPRCSTRGASLRKDKKRSMCQSWIRCDDCNPRVRIPRYQAKQRRDEKHQLIEFEHKCGWGVCRHCDEFEPLTHRCTVTAEPLKPPGDPDRYVCVDLECDPRDAHVPYLIRASVGLGTRDNHGILGGYNAEGEFVGCTPAGDYTEGGAATGKRVWFWFEGADCAKKFVEWCYVKREKDKRGFTVLAYNGSNYDYPVLYPWIYAVKDEAVRRTIKPIYRGTQLITIRIGRGKNAIHFKDLMLHTTNVGPLSKLPKVFGFAAELKECGLSGFKDHFPHRLHLTANDAFQQYSGPLPPVNCYPTLTEPDERKAFEAWYAAEAKLYVPHTDREWNFVEQSKLYNHNDVELLRRGAREFRYQAMLSSAPSEDRINEGCDPLQYLTTPAACIALFRAKDMQPGTLPNYTLAANRIFRKGMHGGRVEATQFFWPPPSDHPDYSATEQLKKVDINSLYPAVEARYRYPRGFPDELCGYPAPLSKWPKDLWQPDPENGEQLLEPTPLKLDTDDELEEVLDYLLDDKRFSFLIADITPPKDLLVPVLPEKVNGKLKFHLEPLKKYAVFSPLLRLAREKNYKVTRLYGAAVWNDVPLPKNGVFKSYVQREMREKDEASGWPKECKTDEQKQQFLRDYAAHPLNKLLGLELRSERIEDNPGRKAVAKLRLNNLWGKMTQKEIYSETTVFHGDQIDAFFDLLHDVNKRVQQVFVLKDNMVEVAWKKEFRRPKLAPGEEEEAEDEEEKESYAELERLLEDDNPRPTPSLHSVIPGALVPMYGQIEMYRYMDRLGAQRCYMDTDSLIYRYDSENKTHYDITEVGRFLGQFKVS